MTRATYVGETKAARQEREREVYRADCARWFRDHKLTECSPSRALFRRLRADGTSDSAFWFEVVMLSGHKLLVHGDIDAVIFAYHGRGVSLEGAVGWIANNALGSSYVREKANIGMNVPMLSNDRIEMAHTALKRAHELLSADANAATDADAGAFINALFALGDPAT